MLVAQTSINAGSNMELTCSASTDTRRNHQWKWYHNSKLISTKDERYSINNATRAHMGMYQCCYIISSSDSNDCCAQTQILVISKLSWIVFIFHIDLPVKINKKMFISTARRHSFH